MKEFKLAGKRVYVAGDQGMVGSAIIRRLASEDCFVLTSNRVEVDLREQSAVRRWFELERPEVVFLAAARVGGILANSIYPAAFLYDNLMIQSNIIEAARQSGVEKLLFLGSSCIYPKFAKQPIEEDALLTGALEPTNQWYAIAKIAGIKLVQSYRRQYQSDFISAMPTNLYGIGDNFDLRNSHVLPALIRKAHVSKVLGSPSLQIWGTGNPRREFMYVDDLADACVFLMRSYSSEEHINIGFGSDISIIELAKIVAKIVGFEGTITTDPAKPDGTFRKLMSSKNIEDRGWKPRVGLADGIRRTYDWYKGQLSDGRIELTEIGSLSS